MRWRAVVITAGLVAQVSVAAMPATPDPPARLVGGVGTHTVQQGESLRTIGSRFGVEPRVIAAQNGRPLARALLPGTELRLDTRHLLPEDLPEGLIVINIPQRMLFYRTPERVFAFPVAVGSAGWRTPLGPFTITQKERDPTWDVPASIAREAAAKGKPLPPRIGPGPGNPLGRHWLRTSLGAIGIHGTNAPASLFQAVTHGCIRVHPDDIAQLFDLVIVGTPGRIVYEPVLIARHEGEVYLEAHRDVYRLLRVHPTERVREFARASGVDADIDWVVAGQVIDAREGLAHPVGARPASDRRFEGRGEVCGVDPCATACIRHSGDTSAHQLRRRLFPN